MADTDKGFELLAGEEHSGCNDAAPVSVPPIAEESRQTQDPESNVGWASKGWSSYDNSGCWVSCFLVAIIQFHMKVPLVVDGKKDTRKMKKSGVNICLFIPSIMEEETWDKVDDSCFWKVKGNTVFMPIPCCEIACCYCGCKICPDWDSLE